MLNLQFEHVAGDDLVCLTALLAGLVGDGDADVSRVEDLVDGPVGICDLKDVAALGEGEGVGVAVLGDLSSVEAGDLLVVVVVDGVVDLHIRDVGSCRSLVGEAVTVIVPVVVCVYVGVDHVAGEFGARCVQALVDLEAEVESGDNARVVHAYCEDVGVLGKDCGIEGLVLDRAVVVEGPEVHGLVGHRYDGPSVVLSFDGGPSLFVGDREDTAGVIRGAFEHREDVVGFYELVLGDTLHGLPGPDDLDPLLITGHEVHAVVDVEVGIGVGVLAQLGDVVHGDDVPSGLSFGDHVSFLRQVHHLGVFRFGRREGNDAAERQVIVDIVAAAHVVFLSRTETEGVFGGAVIVHLGGFRLDQREVAEVGQFDAHIEVGAREGLDDPVLTGIDRESQGAGEGVGAALHGVLHIGVVCSGRVHLGRVGVVVEGEFALDVLRHVSERSGGEGVLAAESFELRVVNGVRGAHFGIIESEIVEDLRGEDICLGERNLQQGGVRYVLGHRDAPGVKQLKIATILEVGPDGMVLVFRHRERLRCVVSDLVLVRRGIAVDRHIDGEAGAETVLDSVVAFLVIAVTLIVDGDGRGACDQGRECDYRNQ